MTNSDQPRRLAFELPDRIGNPTSSVKFTLGEHEFDCRPDLDGITLLEFAQMAGDAADPDGEGMSPEQAAAYSGAILGFLQTCITDYPRFRGVVREYGVSVDTLGTIASELIESYTARPTQSPPGL